MLPGPKFASSHHRHIFLSIQPLGDFPNNRFCGTSGRSSNHSSQKSFALNMIIGSNTDPSAQIPSITVANSHFPGRLVKSFPPLHG
ncbi:hypothetical protein L873DRAFT_1887640 [Choiromyces venosus 120613-1]|uniref:Uncharacterized protein n=1 Tax=Choiromyces venosus 120613-1 TaxID=1336337 RepID=A0A3N4IUW2_9PEZI|nr:hypothetical protein L873DRAFT_1887640 [Choiromyces venosus 120613-1]